MLLAPHRESFMDNIYCPAALVKAVIISRIITDFPHSHICRLTD